MSCEALVLDFGGVVTRTLFETHELTEQALGLPHGSLTWQGPFNPEQDVLWQSMQAGDISERDYWALRMKETAALVGEQWDEFPQFIARVRGDEPQAVIRPEAVAAIDSAKRAGKKLAILSNELDLFYGAGFRQKLPFMAKFDAIVDATYSKILKPDPRAYKAVCQALGLAAEHCVFVDDQAKNIRGGQSYGMQCVHFDVTQPTASYQTALALLGID